LEKTKELCGSS